jgi:hypothetical protein
MTVDRTHVLATPGLDAHGSYVALSRHRDGMDLHYGRDDFAGQDKLIRALSRDRAKDMASDYQQLDPARDYAERRGITFKRRVVEIVRKLVPETVRDRIDELMEGLRFPGEDVPGHQIGKGPERGMERAATARPAPAMPERVEAEPQAQRDAADDIDEALRKARTRALIRHARAIDTILATGDTDGKGSREQMRELTDARKAFEDVRPHGWRDAEAAYVKNPELVRETATGQVNRAIRALQLETEIRIEPQRRADRFVERWQKLDRTSQRQYQAGDMSGFNTTRSAMGDMAKSLERDPQMESLLANRRRELGIGIESGRSLGRELAFTHGIDLGRGRGLGL